jgi:hypothetical protein
VNGSVNNSFQMHMEEVHFPTQATSRGIGRLSSLDRCFDEKSHTPVVRKLGSPVSSFHLGKARNADACYRGPLKCGFKNKVHPCAARGFDFDFVVNPRLP